MNLDINRTIALTIFSSWLIGYLRVHLFAMMTIPVIFVMCKYQIHTLTFDEDDLLSNWNYLSLENISEPNWMNMLIKRWWAIARDHIEEQAQTFFTTYIHSNKPFHIETIEVETISVGDHSPVVGHLEMSDSTECVIRQLAQSLGLGRRNLRRGVVVPISSWYQGSIKGEFSYSSPDLLMVFRGKLLGVRFKVSVTELSINSKVEALITINKEKSFPHIQKLEVFLIETPKITFNVNVFEKLNIMHIPFVKEWIKKMVYKSMRKHFVYPEHDSGSPSAPASPQS